MFHRFASSAARLSLPALLLVPALFASPGARAAGLPPGLDPGTKAALLKMPAYNPPAAYSEDLVITTGDQTMTMKRFVDGSKMRTDMNAQGQDFSMIELGDAAGTMYNIVPKQKQAIKMTSRGMMEGMPKAAGKPDTTETETPPPPGYKVEYLGEETVDGRATKKFRMTTDEGSALGWFDAANGAPVRMEGTSDGKKAVMEWKNFKAAAQPASVFEVPKGYEVVDMDAMREQMKGMPGMGNMMKNMAGGMAGGMMGGMGQNMGAQLGGAVGGPLGAMAGGFLGGRVGSEMGRKAAEKATGQ
jgi:outer membrane lipoprotein-sorting protein